MNAVSKQLCPGAEHRFWLTRSYLLFAGLPDDTNWAGTRSVGLRGLHMHTIYAVASANIARLVMRTSMVRCALTIHTSVVVAAVHFTGVLMGGHPFHRSPCRSGLHRSKKDDGLEISFGTSKTPRRCPADQPDLRVSALSSGDWQMQLRCTLVNETTA
jgi:hypothetical protein